MQGGAPDGPRKPGEHEHNDAFAAEADPAGQLRHTK
jgi:hypothetical protein